MTSNDDYGAYFDINLHIFPKTPPPENIVKMSSTLTQGRSKDAIIRYHSQEFQERPIPFYGRELLYPMI